MVMLFAPFGRTPFSLCGTKEVTSQDESFIQSTEGFISESVNFKATLVEENWEPELGLNLIQSLRLGISWHNYV